MSLESIDDVHSSDGFSSGMLSVSHGISNDSFKEALEDLSAVVINEGRDSLDTSSSGESSDGGFGDTFNHGSASSVSDVSLLGNFSVSFT